MNFYRGCDVGMLESANYRDPLDALRRFIPTPLKTRLRVGLTTLQVATNDLSLVPDLPPETVSKKLMKRSLDWKLVRDDDARGILQEPLQLTSGALTVVTMGTACLLGVDRERGELLCFIGADVDEKSFQEILVPMLCNLSIDDMEAESFEFVSHLQEDSNDA
jgi:hypothetical protein